MWMRLDLGKYRRFLGAWQLPGLVFIPQIHVSLDAVLSRGFVSILISTILRTLKWNVDLPHGVEGVLHHGLRCFVQEAVDQRDIIDSTGEHRKKLLVHFCWVSFQNPCLREQLLRFCEDLVRGLLVVVEGLFVNADLQGVG